MAGKNDRSSGFLGQVLAAGKEKNYSHSQIAVSLLAEVAAAAAPYSAALATIVDHYLDADAQDVKAGFVDSKAVRQALGICFRRTSSEKLLTV
jgi:urea transporter